MDPSKEGRKEKRKGKEGERKKCRTLIIIESRKTLLAFWFMFFQTFIHMYMLFILPLEDFRVTGVT